jgi:hypothetical protein
MKQPWAVGVLVEHAEREEFGLRLY